MESRKRSLVAILSVSLLVLSFVNIGCNDDDANELVRLISPADAVALIQSSQGDAAFIILDVRTPAEFAEGHLTNAQNVDFFAESFSGQISALAKGNTYLVYCRSGGRSGQATDMMANLGFASLYDVDGGFLALSQLGAAASLIVSGDAD